MRGPLEATSSFWRKLVRGRSADEREPLFLEMLSAALEDGMSVIEIGSNDGCETVHALKSGKRGLRIFVLEPDEANLARAQAAVSRVGGNSVRFFRLGMSDSSGRRPFFVNREASNLNAANPQQFEGYDRIETEYVTLVQFVERERIEPPLLVKMDIEGHEVEVLAGGMQFLERARRTKILMEVHPATYNASHSLADQLGRLFAAGYRTTYVESAGLPVPSKFRALGLEPLKVRGHRGLYRNVADDIVLDCACTEHVEAIDYAPGFTQKIVRSLLIEKN
jgi:FkbM family methyltransferase